MNLKDIDLNLLVVFNHLLMEGSVSGAAVKLGLTQPAVSNALKRLRTLLDDELFIRTANGMEPTAHALQLAEPIAYALGTIENALVSQADFNPASSLRQFTIGMTDLGEIELLPRLMNLLQDVAPGTTISTVRDSGDNLRDAMAAGHVDLAIGLLPQLKTGFFQQRLFMQRYVCLFKAGHPIDRSHVSKQQFFGADHVTVISGGTGHAEINKIIDSGKVKRRIRLYVPHFVALGHILSTTDMIATAPERYAKQCAAPFGLKYTAPPIELPKFSINLFWHARFHREPGNQWLRKQIFTLFSSGEAG